MQLKFAAGAALAVGIFGFGPLAAAADLSYPSVRAPIVAASSAPSWTGFYAGVGIGAVFGNARGDSTFISPATGGITTIGMPDLASSSASANIYGGYNYQVAPQVVLGLEAEANWLNAGFSSGYNGGFSGDFMTADWQFGISGRAGILLNPTSLVYLKVGYAWTEMSINAVNYFGGPLPAGITATVNDGYRSSAIIGAGVETIISPSWLARLEAEYTVGAQNSTISIPAYAVTDKVNADYLSARLGLAYKF